MRRIMVVLLLAVCVTYGNSGCAAEAQPPCRHFFDSVHANMDAILRDNQTSFVQKRSALTALFEQAMDADWIARFVAQGYWDKASEQQRQDFVKAYKPYLSDHYIGALDEDDLNEMLSLAVVDFKPTGNSRYLARTQITLKKDDPVVFDLRLEEQPAGVCHVRDFTIEGVSQISTQRDEIQAQAGQGGLKVVTQKLREVMQAKQ